MRLLIVMSRQHTFLRTILESSFRNNVEPSGLLRVACPTALAHPFVLPHVPAFLERYPQLNLDLQLNDRYVDLINEGTELAMRIGHLEDSTLRARRLGWQDRVFVASKDYLAKRGVPQTPDDLRDHDCIIYTLLSSGGDLAIPGAPLCRRYKTRRQT
ncbi:LysR substrate binding domain-containing protein [Pseudomonas sp. NFACC24-1]|uniref:substrate binding domain-containing protein n=1 Tax=Pseudomonas sp. NFACC24-1 TaxID=1566189 RepID=UPI0008E197FC|nr:substrate binding domain-containing protein [Pseudomonas sp. NFACC24-1]SFO99545.1 LysR substrate binding domain-containing protein [Pseudomonas sp. NFACC24-1]